MVATGLGVLMAINPALGFAALSATYVVLICAFGIAMRRIRKRRRALEAELFRSALDAARRATQPRPSTVEMEPTGADGGGSPE